MSPHRIREDGVAGWSMSADLKLDTGTGDLVVAGSDVALVYDDDAVRQRLKIRLQDIRGEWFRDTTQGTDWFGKILGKRTTELRTAEFRRVIMGTEGVRGIARFELERDPDDSRKLNLTFTAIKDGGAELDVRFDGFSAGGAA